MCNHETHRDSSKLSPAGPVSPARKWRTTYQVPFAAQMIWEKFTCASSYVPRLLMRGDTLTRPIIGPRRFKGPQMRLVLNDAPLPLTICRGMDKKLGSCSLDDFVAVNAASRKISWGNAAWNATCGAAGF